MRFFQKYFKRNNFLLAIIFLFGVAIFTSKTAMSLFGVSLVIWALFSGVIQRIQSQKKLIFFIGLFPLGIFLNLFSIGGIKSSVHVLGAWLVVLLILPAFLIAQEKTWFSALKWGVVTGFLLGCVKALWSFYVDFGFSLHGIPRVSGFLDFIRWGVVLAILSLVLLNCLIYQLQIKSKNLEKVGTSLLLICSLIFLILVNSRGAWLGFGVGALLLGLFQKKGLLVTGVILIGATLMVFSIPSLRQRLISTFDVIVTNAGSLESADNSNAGRLQMWKVAFDFYQEYPLLGVGFNNSTEPLKKFITQQSLEYQRKYVKGEFVYHDHHSSYLNSLIQMGIIFFILFWGFFLSILVDVVRKKSLALRPLVVSIVGSYLFMFIYYSGYVSYEACLLYMSIGLFYGHCPQAFFCGVSKV
jgi:O-antigen ligase